MEADSEVMFTYTIMIASQPQIFKTETFTLVARNCPIGDPDWLESSYEYFFSTSCTTGACPPERIDFTPLQVDQACPYSSSLYIVAGSIQLQDAVTEGALTAFHNSLPYVQYLDVEKNADRP